MRIIITGGPRTGKTTLADRLGTEGGVPVHHMDDTLGMDWSEASLQISRELDQPGPWIREGVQAPRALRKWLDRNATGAPCDRLVYLKEPRATLNAGQARMTKGVATVFAEIEPELMRRGVAIVVPNE